MYTVLAIKMGHVGNCKLESGARQGTQAPRAPMNPNYKLPNQQTVIWSLLLDSILIL
jgi:hypothetical protein